MRVFELARDIGMSSKDIIARASAEGIALNNHMVAVPDSLEEKLRAERGKGTPAASAPSAAQIATAAAVSAPAPAPASAPVGQPVVVPVFAPPTSVPAAQAASAAAKPAPGAKPVPEPARSAPKSSPSPAISPSKPSAPPSAVSRPAASSRPAMDVPRSAARPAPSKPAPAPVIPAKPVSSKPAGESKKISLPFPLRVVDIGRAIDKSAAELVGKLMGMGMMVSANAPLDKDTAVLLSSEYGYDLTIKEDEPPTPVEVKEIEENEDPKNLRPRPPVVVVMGHVDHGKTTLLDSIRKTKVAAGEFGGITQHIGAYNVPMPNGKSITFLDTPGHEAFTAMRARGANVTDIAVLVVAADDGVMRQTVEAISHAKAAAVPIIVVINKVDKASGDNQRVLKELSDHGVTVEGWGGDTVVVEVSALKGTNISSLLEMITIQSEMLELKASPLGPASGTVIESRIERGRGATATVLIQKGTLHVGDIFVCGTTHGRVKALIDDAGQRMKEAGPAMPAEILGFIEAPQAGDRFMATSSEKRAKEIAEERGLVRKDMARRRSDSPLTLDAMTDNLREGEKTALPLLLKTDVQGSLEAIRDALERLRNDEVPIRVLHAALGGITESDVLLAAASGSIILGFNVRPDERATAAVEREGVDVRTYRIIYELLDDVRKAVTGRMAPRQEEKVVAVLEVRNTFKISRFGTIAGCLVKEGKIERRHKIRVVRDGAVVYEGKIGSLKRFKDDAREVDKGFECGVLVENFNDVKVGDVLEVFMIEETAATLEG